MFGAPREAVVWRCSMVFSMSRVPRWFALVAVLSLVPALASAGPRERTGGDRGTPEERRERREKLLRRSHTMMVMELGDRLGLDSAAVIKLSERLKKFDDERVSLRLANLDLMRELRASGDAPAPNAVASVKKLAANRVRLAQIDEAELAELLTQVPPDKAALVASFVGEFSNRLERIAREVFREKRDGDRGHGRDRDELE